MSLLVKLNIRYIQRVSDTMSFFNTLSRSIAENELKKMDPSYGTADLYLNTTIGRIIIKACRHQSPSGPRFLDQDLSLTHNILNNSQIQSL